MVALRKIVLACLLVFLSSFCFAQSALSFHPDRFLDLGRIPGIDHLKFQWTVENVTEDTVILDRVATTSGAVTGWIENKVIPPGGQTILHGALGAKGRSGRFRKDIILFLTQPSETLRVTFQVDLLHPGGELEGLFKTIDLGDISPPQTIKLAFKLPEEYGDQNYFLHSLTYHTREGEQVPELIPWITVADRELRPGEETEFEIFFRTPDLTRPDWPKGLNGAIFVLKTSPMYLDTPPQTNTGQWLKLTWNIVEDD
ncbi:MAG: DUF1573 domain-containing protein [Bacteroidia bacterium]|nr:DUF1573 domain-containing protein [Bacteroidia bacterium]